MPVTLNPRTNLEETFHGVYKIPIVHQRSVGSLKFNGQMVAVHTVPIAGGLTLDFYAKLKRSDELIVVFPGANPRHKNTYPRFPRVRSISSHATAFISFADPTIMADPKRKMLLSWCLGGPTFDPAPLMLRVIRKAQGKTGASRVVFVGGSGGGFVALRISAMMPGSLAFVNDSATNVAKSMPKTVARYFSTVWPGWGKDKLLQAFPERFDMVRHYLNYKPQNFVYYAQNRDDAYYRENHYTPFSKANGVSGFDGDDRGGLCRFVLYTPEVAGHGNITATEFDYHFHAAKDWWRIRRQLVLGSGGPDNAQTEGPSSG